MNTEVSRLVSRDAVAIGAQIERALALTRCAGIAAMAAELIAARDTIANQERELKLLRRLLLRAEKL